jgi:hypothetical protein
MGTSIVRLCGRALLWVLHFLIVLPIMIFFVFFFMWPMILFREAWSDPHIRRHLELLEESGQDMDDGIIAEFQKVEHKTGTENDITITTYKIRYAYQVGETRFMSNRLFIVDEETANASAVKLKFLPDKPTTATLVYSIQHRDQDDGMQATIIQVLGCFGLSLATSATVLIFRDVYVWIGVLAVTMLVGFSWALYTHQGVCLSMTEVAIPIPDDVWTACREKNSEEIQKFLQQDSVRSRLVTMGGIHAPLVNSLGEIFNEYRVDDFVDTNCPDETNNDDEEAQEGVVVLVDLKHGAKSSCNSNETREII